MYKIILSIFIFFLFVSSIKTMKQRIPQLPREMWTLIPSELIDFEAIKSATTLSDLKKGFYQFLLLSKMHNQIANDLAIKNLN